MKKTLLICCLCTLCVLSACSINLSSSQITDKILMAESYYIEYTLSYTHTDDIFCVREWYQAPDLYYMEVAKESEKLLRVQISEQNTILAYAGSDKHLIIQESPYTTLKTIYTQFIDLNAHKMREGGYCLSTAVNQTPVYLLACNKHGLPEKITISLAHMSKQIDIQKIELNCKHDQCIFKSLGT